MGKMQERHNYPELFLKDDNVFESRENIANMFNKFFTSIGPYLVKQMGWVWILLIIELINEITSSVNNNGILLVYSLAWKKLLTQ